MEVGTTANAMTFTLGFLDLTIANMGSRVIAMGDLFTQWRIIKLQMDNRTQLYSVLNTPQIVRCAVAYTPTNGSDLTPPTTFPQMCDFPNYVEFTGGNTRNMKIERKGLDFPLIWAQTNNASTINELSSCGTFMSAVISTGGDTISTLETTISGVIAFRYPVDPASHPLDYVKKLKTRISLLENYQEKKNEFKIVPLSAQGPFQLLKKEMESTITDVKPHAEEFIELKEGDWKPCQGSPKIPPEFKDFG